MRARRIDLGSIGVYVEKDANDVYDALTSRAANKAEHYPFAVKKDLFMLAACVGAQQGIYKELMGKPHQIADSDQFDRDNDVPILAALAFHRSKNLETLFNAREILDIAQAWANGGIHIVHQQLLSGKASRPLYNLIDMVSSQLPKPE